MENMNEQHFGIVEEINMSSVMAGRVFNEIICMQVWNWSESS